MHVYLIAAVIVITIVRHLANMSSFNRPETWP